MPDDAVGARVAQIRAQIAEWRDGKRERDAAWAWVDMGLLCDALAAAEQERDEAWEYAADAIMAHRLAVKSLRHAEALNKRELAIFEARDRSLAALEAAAREIAVLWPSDPKLWGWEEVEALVEAVAALPPAAGVPGA